MGIGIRREKIREYLLNCGEASFTELREICPDVSDMTIRRDLAYLEGQGFIIRTRGGARASGPVNGINGIKEDIYSKRSGINVEAKMKIGMKALVHFETGRAIFVDSGTTTMCMVKMLPDENYSIITSAPNICMDLMKNMKPAVTLVGGKVSRDNVSASGEYSLKFIKNINIDIAFMAASAFSLKSGFTSGDYYECELKKAVIRKAGKVIMLMDAGKVGKDMPYTFARLRDIDILICDRPLPGEIVKEANSCGTKIE
ncbi:MAG: DeoR/GlpR family DNA-binding transcription regulator [Eubacteriales bacterium]|nr:DeoR/GlpR family DNA-binding transcription regulator [Eubacteriales bacterium]